MAGIPGTTASSLVATTEIDARSMLVRELAGCLAGPFHYVAARRSLPQQAGTVTAAATSTT